MALTNAMVGLQKEFGGKGPTKARSYWAGDDMLVVLMGGGYTSAEETLYQGGRGSAVRDSRHAFEDVMEQRMREVIQGLTGREVIAFMSASHQSPDLTLEAFVLAPTETESPASATDQTSPEPPQ
jgi:uncharacterized protein YbcI